MKPRRLDRVDRGDCTLKTLDIQGFPQHAETAFMR